MNVWSLLIGLEIVHASDLCLLSRRLVALLFFRPVHG